MTQEVWNNFFQRFMSSAGAAYLKPLLLVFGVYLPYVAGFYVFARIISSKSFKLRVYYVSLAILSVLISGVLTNIFRNIFRNLRPYAETGIGNTTGVELGFGFPSSHMALFIPLAIILFSIDRRAGFIFFAFTLVMGLSRLLLLLHYPGDLLFGIIVGIVGFFAAKILLPYRLTRQE